MSFLFMVYRHDIDGLRSIAVMMVVLYHFGFSSISGGFVGVDVFFVLSGFLITNIISKQIIEKTFSFETFFIRRIKRLMPALLVMVLVTLIVSGFILAPSDYARLAESVIWISSYAGNFFFWTEYGGYFSGDTREAPLLHTWSLAVEEQFYLLWPLFIYGAYKWIGTNKTIILSLVGTLFLIWASQYATEVTVGAAYYLLPTRAFELMIGATLALAWPHIRNLSKRTNDLLSISGIGLIIYSGITLSKYDSFPGYNALYPTIGAALLLLSGKGECGLVNKCLSIKPLVFIGMISYSLYLWHWPLVVMVNYMAIELTFTTQLILLLVAFVVSYLSYTYIEEPCRKSKDTSNVAINKFYATSTLAVIIVSSFVINTDGLSNRFDENLNSMDSALNTHSNVLRSECHAALNQYERAPSENCFIGEKGADKRGFMFGDSHANHYTGLVDTLGKAYNFEVQDYTLDRCPPIFDLQWGKNSYKGAKCLERNGYVRKHLKDSNFDFVVLAASWPNERSKMVYINNENIDSTQTVIELSDKINNTVTELVGMGLDVIIIKDTPFIIDNKPNCPLKKAMFNESMDCSIANNPNEFLSAQIELMKESHGTNLTVIEPRDVMCRGGRCSLSLEGIPLYRDVDHLNDLGSRKVGELLIEQYHEDKNMLTDAIEQSVADQSD